MRKAGANRGYWDLALLFVLLTVPRLVTARTIFFPHYGDGDGLSMAIVVNNLSSERATGVLRAFAPDGGPQLLPFLSGSAEEIPLDLPPRGSKTLVTAGSSDPLKTDYPVLEMDTTEVRGGGNLSLRQRHGGERGALGTRVQVLPSRREQRRLGYRTRSGQAAPDGKYLADTA